MIFLLWSLKNMVYGLFNMLSGRFSGTNIIYMNFLLCLNSV